MISPDDLRALRCGELSFAVFAVRTRPDFVRLARKFARDVRLPLSLDVEDIAHEMLMSVPGHLAQWRENGSPIVNFIVFRTHKTARVLVQSVQASKRRESKYGHAFELVRSAPPDSDDVLARKERMRELVEEIPRTDLQRAVVRSLVRTGSIDDTVMDLVCDPRTQQMFADSKPKSTRGPTFELRLVRKKVTRVAYLMADLTATQKGNAV